MLLSGRWIGDQVVFDKGIKVIRIGFGVQLKMEYTCIGVQLLTGDCY